MKVESVVMRALIIGVVSFVALGCTKPNPNRCCNDEADCTAKGIPVGSICEQGLVCRGNQCISEPCNGAADCDAAAPYCVAELCSESCNDDSECPGFMQDPSNLFCVNGQCVACRDSADCSGSAPVCEGGACRGCNADADCASGVCDKETSTCLAEAAVLYVTAGGGTTGCTRSDPCSIAHAFSLVDASRTAVKLGSGSHLIGAAIFGGVKTATVYGPGTVAGDFGPADGATLRMRDVVWNGSPGCLNTATNLPVNTLDLLRVKTAVNYINIDSVCNATIRDSEVRSTSTTGLGH